MNARNLRYIKTKNSIEWISLADSKLKTKHFLSSRGIPFAETYITITTQQDLQNFSLKSIKADSFVIKPNKWSRGRGILLVHREGNQYKIQDDYWTEAEIRLHMVDILHWSFSLYGSSDIVVIEELLSPGIDFTAFCRYGLADIRVVVYNLVPVLAMVRMPTQASGWKANLDIGAYWFGINIANGEIISMYHDKKTYTHHFLPWFEWLRWKQIPFWDDILLLSSQVQMYTNIGFIGMDWVITKNGPKLLEMNARAWLKIQNVNLTPLEVRLKKVEDLKILSPEKWVEVAKTLFHTETLFSWVGKKILYLEQRWIVWDKVVSVEIDMTKKYSYVSKDVVDCLWNQQIHILTDLNVSIVLEHFEVLPSSNGKVILWMEAIGDYLINPSIYVSDRKIEHDAIWTKDIIDFDNEVYRISKKINLSSLLKPDNYFVLLDTFIHDPKWYNPIFHYHFPNAQKIESLKISLWSLREKAHEFKQAWFNIAELYIEKLAEIENKLSLVEAYRDENFEKILYFNTVLFGKTDVSTLQIAKEKVFEMKWHEKNDELILGKVLTLDQIIIRIHAYFETHSISKIPITIESGNLSRMSVSYGKEVKIHISKNAVIREREIDAILSHEIGTHFRRYLAGKEQGLKLFQFGTGYYLSDEEGFAIHRSFSHLPDGYEKNAMYVKYYLLDTVDTLSFSETVELLRTLYPEKSLESIFSDTVRLKRWITHSWTRWIQWTTYQKDKIYLDGYIRVKKWLDIWGNAEKLFFGKIKIQDLKILELL